MRTSCIPLSGKHPGVLIWPDIFGLRPAFRQMGKRLAEAGYAVLVVNPFYRTKKAPTAPEKPDFDDPATREMLDGLKDDAEPGDGENRREGVHHRGSTASRRSTEAEDRHDRLLHGRPARVRDGGDDARIASAPRQLSTAAASSRTSPTARTCSSRR